MIERDGDDWVQPNVQDGKPGLERFWRYSEPGG